MDWISPAASREIRISSWLPPIYSPASREGADQAAKEDKSIHSNRTWWLDHLLSENWGWNHSERRSSLFLSLFKQKPLSETDGKYVLAAESVVIGRAECSQFCRLCRKDVGKKKKKKKKKKRQPPQGVYGSAEQTAAPPPSPAAAKQPLAWPSLGPICCVCSQLNFWVGEDRTVEGSCH